jgi:hypothetical protein
MRSSSSTLADLLASGDELRSGIARIEWDLRNGLAYNTVASTRRLDALRAELAEVEASVLALLDEPRRPLPVSAWGSEAARVAAAEKLHVEA